MYLDQHSGPDYQEMANAAARAVGSAGITKSAKLHDTPPGFLRGTKIRTYTGDKPVEKLTLFDRIETVDHGFIHPIWIGRSRPAPNNRAQIIEINRGVLGNKRKLCVPAEQQILLTGSKCEILFGEDEVIAVASDLCDGKEICSVKSDGRAVYHVLFAAAEILTAEGTKAASFHPGFGTVTRLSAEDQADVLKLMPEFSENPGAFGPAARMVVKGDPAKVLVSALVCSPNLARRLNWVE